MKKSFVSLLTIAAITFGMVSCNSSKKQDAAEQKVEEEAAIAGEVSKGLLTAELKDEVTRFLKDMPDSELPYKVSTGEVTISVANTDFMLAGQQDFRIEHTSPESTCLRYLLRRLERIEGYEKADYRYRERIG